MTDRPRPAAQATSSAGESVPSDAVECVCRSIPCSLNVNALLLSRFRITGNAVKGHKVFGLRDIETGGDNAALQVNNILAGEGGVVVRKEARSELVD